MKPIKILILSSIFLFANCSYVNDKFISKSDKTNDKSNEQEQEIVMEKVYIEDDNENKEVVRIEEGLRGDFDNQETDYPNLADVPSRPDTPISIDEQEKIIKSLENNTQLEAVPSEPILEKDLSNLDTKFNNVDIKVNKKVSKKNISNEDTNNSIRSIQMSKLEEISNFKPDLSNSSQQNVTEQEQELHDLARQLKNLDNIEKVKEVEEKIKKNDLYYTPQDIDKILGFQRSDNSLQKKEAKKEMVAETFFIEKEKTEEPAIAEKEKVAETTIVKKRIDEREIPVARVTFNHGSTQLSNNDLSKIKSVAELFYKNEGKKIVIVGHASSRTNYDMDLTKHALVNFNISLERARRVMKEFSTIGFNSTNIELVAMSDASPLYAEIMPSLEAANRRAEIFIQY